MAHFSGFLASQKGIFFFLSWLIGFLCWNILFYLFILNVVIFLIVEILDVVKRNFLPCGMRFRNRLLNLSYHKRKKSFCSQISLHIPSHESKEMYHLHLALSLTFRAQGGARFSKGMHLNSPQPILLVFVDLESPRFL